MKRILTVALMVCLFCLLAGCESLPINITTNTTYTIDYGDDKAFEDALNAGENLEGKVVRFTVKEVHPQSQWGYNLWAGEHLNFVSSRNPDIKEGDEVTVKATVIESIGGSWKISYEKVTNATEDEHTIYTPAETESPAVANNTSHTSEAPQQTTTSSSQAKAEEINGDFTSNQYYDVVEEGSFTNYGYTVLIYKVLAKQNISIDTTMLAYSPEGSVIGKSSSDIVLTEGEYNYFRYSFESDISNATFETTVKAQNTYMDGDRKAIEMVDYNVSGNDLYITFKQVTDNPGTFAKFKLLFYNGDEMIADEEGYFDVYADNLNGVDSTDVASLWVYGKTFDRIEYFYEP